MDQVLELKNNASKLLLVVMESRGDSENAERILYNMNPRQLDQIRRQVRQPLRGLPQQVTEAER